MHFNPREEQSTLSDRVPAIKVVGDSRHSKATSPAENPFAKILSALVFWCLLAVIALAVFPYGTVDPWWETAFECSVFILTAVWIVASVVAGEWQIKRVSLLSPVAAITAYAFVQAIQWPAWLSGSATRHMLSIDHYQTYLTARKSLALTLFLGLLLVHTSTARRFRWLMRAVIAIGLASALFGILRQFLQTSDSPYGFLLPFLFYGLGYAQFISPNAFAYLMEMTLALLAGLILGGSIPRNRLMIYLTIVAVVWTALVLSNSRGGLLSLACGSIFVLFVSLNWYWERRLSHGNESPGWMTFLRNSNVARVAVILLVLAMLGGGVLWIGGDSLTNKLEGPVASADALDGTTRQEIWRASWDLFKNNKLTGTGLGAYSLSIPQYQHSSGRLKLEQAHNDYLELAASGGLIGLALGGWLIGAIVWSARSSFRMRQAYQRAAALGAATGLLGVAVHSFVDFGLQLTGIAVVCSSLVVILVADVPAEADDLHDDGPGKPSSRRRLYDLADTSRRS